MDDTKVITLEYTDIFDDNQKKTISFSKEIIKNHCNEASLFAVMVEGESMQPLIKDKSVVISDLSQKEFVEDSIYLIYYENKMWIKKLVKTENEFFFVSVNTNFSHLVYPANTVHVVAKVLLTFTNL